MTWKKINEFFARARNVLLSILAYATHGAIVLHLVLAVIPSSASVPYKSVIYKTKAALTKIVNETNN